ncbi:Pantothenate kinase 2, mitochondrial [Ancistrocladus abbreviatus]
MAAFGRETAEALVDGRSDVGNGGNFDVTELREADSSSVSSYDKILPWALDIGGSLVKLVYFSREDKSTENDTGKRVDMEKNGVGNSNKYYPTLSGKLHFAKFETSKINECLDFIQSNQLHRSSCRHQEVLVNNNIIVKATGGGAQKFADLFKEKLGINLDKEDEMDCLVAGANFLLKAVPHEAFTYMDGRKEFVQINPDDLFPYLLVNIGSGVSMIKVDREGKYERVSGTNVGGGTFSGLGRLLTKCKSFDELLELSHQGNNRVIDMLVGDIYGGMDYSKIGLSATAIASSFGKAISENKELEDYRPEDIARSLLRLISNNIGQIAYLNALLFGLKRILFGGFFIRGHEYTMDTISVAVEFWSKGEAKAMFLRHEGFLGALGAFKSYEKHGLGDLTVHHVIEQSPVVLPHMGQKIHGPLLVELKDYRSIDCSVWEA